MSDSRESCGTCRFVSTINDFDEGSGGSHFTTPNLGPCYLARAFHWTPGRRHAGRPAQWHLALTLHPTRSQTTAMDPEIVQAIARNTIRLRRLAIVLCGKSNDAMQAARAARAKTRHHLEERVRLAKTLREQIIARRLLTGRLPSASAAVLLGGPGAAGNCDGCDQPLTPAQLVMAIPLRDEMVVHLHAGCFIIWNAIRPHTGEGRIN